jgi:hypothetical protein
MNSPLGDPALSASVIAPVRTFQDAIDRVERAYPPAAGRVLKTALRQIARAVIEARARASGQYLDPNRRNRDFSHLAFDLPAINQTLTGMRYRLAGFNCDKSLRNAMSGLRRIGRDLGMVAPHRAPDLPPDNPYVPLLEGADAFEVASARRFAAKMIEDGRHPQDVTGDDLTRYATFLSTQMIGVKIAPTLRRIVDLWRRASDRHPDWPQLPLKPPGKTKPMNPPFNAYSISLQDEIAAIRRRMEGADRQGPFSPECDRKPLRPATAKLRLACIRVILGEHVACGNEPHSVTSFTQLLSAPEAIQAILQSLWERGQARRRAMPEAERDPDGNGNTGQLDAVGVTLLMLVRDFPPPPDVLKKIRWLVSRVRKPPMSGMSCKNRRRIDQFLDPVKTSLLLNLPRQLMTEALELRARRPAEAARLGRTAIFFAIELKIPLRIRNLHTIRLGHNLRFVGAGQKAATLRFQAHEMKNHRALEFFVGPRLCQLLRLYLEHFLPFFTATSPDQVAEQWLFPAGDGKPGPLSDSQVRKTIIDTVAERVGAAFHPHLFRSLAVEFALKHHATGHEHVRQLLGDESLHVVLSHYAPMRTREAAEHQDRLVDREADRLAALAPPLRRRHAAGGRS